MSEKETKKIQLSVLRKQVEEGMKKDALAAYYGLPMTQMTKVLQQAGLKIRKFHKPSFILEDDLEESEKVDNLQSVSEERVEVAEEVSDTEPVTEKVEEVAEIAEVAETANVSPIETEIADAEEVIEVPVVEKRNPWGAEAAPSTLESLLD